jgi:hypothetical protein
VSDSGYLSGIAKTTLTIVKKDRALLFHSRRRFTARRSHLQEVYSDSPSSLRCSRSPRKRRLHFQIRRIRSGLSLLAALAVVGDGGQLIFPGFGRYRHLDSPADRDSLSRSNLQKFDGRIPCHGPSRRHLKVHCNMLGGLVRRITDRGFYFERLSAEHYLLVGS